MHRLDVGQLFDVVARITPGEEAPAGVKIGRAHIRVRAKPLSRNALSP